MLNVIEEGSGKPILFVHGFPVSGRVWMRQLEALSGEHHVVAVDLPGFGDSPASDALTMSGFAAQLKELISARHLSNVLLIGWSMGGCVVMSYCEQFRAHGLRAIGIVDVSPKLLPSDDWPWRVGTPFTAESLANKVALWKRDRRAVARDIYTIGFRNPEAHLADRDLLVEESLKAHPDTINALLDAHACDFRESVGRIEVPTILLYGAHSSSTTPQVREFMSRTIPTSKLVLFQESAHCLMFEETEKFNRVVGDFASEVSTVFRHEQESFAGRGSTQR